MKLSGLPVLPLLLLVLFGQIGGALGDYDMCYNSQTNVYKACSPKVADATTNTSVVVTVDPESATCGTPAFNYMRMGDRFDTVFTCDSASNENRHPPEYIVDTDADSWWQSVSPTTNNWDLLITIDIAFGKMYRFAGLVVFIFNYARPEKMVLEKSTDMGQTWTPLQYFARSCSEFSSDVDPSATFSEADPTAVICTNEYLESSSRIREGRRVVYDLDERFGLFWGLDGTNYTNLYINLQNKMLDDLLFTNLRIRLIRLFTDGSTDYNKFFYAIQDTFVMSRCFCNLHASSCSLPNGHIKCDCAHNTEGDNCERCKPLYNEKLWQRGSYIPYPDGTANECVKCECNDHAVSCTYNATYKRGICDSCLHNTQDYHCQNCLSGFYPNVSKALNDVNRCVGCNCNALGVEGNNTVCNRDLNSNTAPGQCICKNLVTNLRCDRCIPGYYGLFLDPQGTCKACDCDRDGTEGQSNTCAQEDGQCPCKASTTGRQCSECADMFYSFPMGNPQGECTPCGCDPGGSTSQVCNKQSGKCDCKAGISGDKCDRSSSGTFVPLVDILLYQPASGDCLVTSDEWTADKPFDGSSFALCDLSAEDASLTFDQITGGMVQVDLSWPYYAAVRYSSISPQTITGTITLTVTGVVSAPVLSDLSQRLNTPIAPECPLANEKTEEINLSFAPGQSTAAMSSETKFQIDARCQYRIQLTLNPITPNTRRRRAAIPNNGIQVDSVILFPSLVSADNSKKLQVLTTSNDEASTTLTYKNCLQKVATLLTRDQTLNSAPCEDLLFTVSSDVHNRVTDCNCDQSGANNPSLCSSLGGQCSCKRGVGGRRCDTCLSGYYNLTTTGCEACGCYDRGSLTGSCDTESGQCSCKTNIQNVATDGATTQEMTAIRTCRKCEPNFYGLDSGNGCSACECNPSGSTSLQCLDDGQCPCKDTVQGLKCDVCKDTFYSFSTTGCSACKCSEAGSTSGNCDQITGKCTCKKNALGDKCDTCSSGHFNLATYNPDGCQQCFCFEHSTICSSAYGFELGMIQTSNPENPAELLGDRHTSYGRVLNFSLAADYSLDISGETLVTIEGANGDVIYHQANENTLITSDQPLTYQVNLFERFWQSQSSNDSLTSLQMLRTLAEIKSMTFIVNSKGQTVRVSLVHMEIPVANQMAIEAVNFVENCTCMVARNVQGLSCELCNVGFRRPTPESASSYETCAACDCSSKGETNPPECDEVTGKCLNCRNGTTGNNCENCAPFVTGDNCDTCESTYWGLSEDGCKECGCTFPASTNPVCDKDTGQCDCAVNVVGRTCDKCEENFYRLQADGCIECDTCYSLLKTEIVDIREARNYLAANVSLIEQRDEAFGDIQPFVERFKQATEDTTKLINFLNSARNAEAEVLNNITTLHDALETIQPHLTTIENSSLREIEERLSQIGEFIDTAENQRGKLTASATTANTKVGTLKTSSATLKTLATDLLTVKEFLEELAQASSSDRKLVEELNHLNTTAHTSNNLASILLKTVQDANQLQQNTTATLLRLESEIITLMAKVAETLTSARSLASSSQETTASAAKLQTNLAEIQALTFNFPSLTERTQRAKGITDIFEAQVTKDSETFNEENIQFQATSETAQDLTNRTNTAGNTAAELVARAGKAEQKMLSIETKVNEIFDSAKFARDILGDFSARASAIEAEAEQALNQVSTVQTLSRKLINESQALSEALSVLQQIASSAYQASEQALQAIQPKLTVIQEVSNEATELENRFANLESGYESRANNINATRDIVVNPANNTCQGVKINIGQFQTKLAAATESADTALIKASNVTTRANNILTGLRNLQRVDTASVEMLLQDVQAAEESLNADDVKVLVNELIDAKISQQEEIERLTKQKNDLQAKVQVLQGMLQQIRPVDI